MLVYTVYKAEKPVRLSVTPITHLGLLTLPYQLPSTIKHLPTTSLSPQVNAVISLRSAAG